MGVPKRPARRQPQAIASEEIVAARELMSATSASSQLPRPERLTSLRDFVERLSSKELRNVEHRCNFKAWLKKQDWGSENAEADRLYEDVTDKILDAYKDPGMRDKSHFGGM